MDFLKKIFTRNTLKIEKTSEMLNEDVYWELIENSLKNTNNQEKQEKFLIKELKKLSLKDIIGFRLRTDKLLFETYNSEMWCAGYIINGGCSDDAFEYFRTWVISRGKDVYYKAKENPDSLISQKDSCKDLDYIEFELFWYVAVEAFNQITKKDLYDFIDDENFHTREGNYPDIEFNWEEENPETMKSICPELYDFYWEKLKLNL